MNAVRDALQKLVEAKKAEELAKRFSPKPISANHATKVARENEELHKTSAYLAEEARRVERLMDRKRWSN